MSALLQLTRCGVVVASDAELDVAARQFARDRRLHLPQFIAPDLWNSIQPRVTHAPFKLRIAQHVRPPAVDLKLDDPTVQGTLRWLMSDRALFGAVERLTACDAIASFNGSVYRLLQGQGHHDSWHDDVDGHRAVAITVNLSAMPFEGGELQMRDTATKQVMWRFANTGPGDGLLFAIDLSLEHCIAPMRGNVAKTALAGWFCRRG